MNGKNCTVVQDDFPVNLLKNGLIIQFAEYVMIKACEIN